LWSTTVLEKVVEELLILKEGFFEVLQRPNLGIAFDKRKLKAYMVK